MGGSLENRLRLHREVLRAIRQRVGDDDPLLIKLGVQDGFSGGLEFEEGKVAAQRLAQWGYDAVEVSQGLRGECWAGTEYRIGIKHVEDEAYFRTWCAEISQLVDVPTMMVGGLRTLPLMEEVVERGDADMVSLCRPLIR